MRRVWAMTVILFALAPLLLAGEASAAGTLPKCSAQNPATLVYDPDSSSGLGEGKIKLDHGEASIQKTTYAFKVTGCDAAGLGLVDAQLRGLRDDKAANIALVAKAADKMSLEVDFKNSDLQPGSYQLTIVSGSAAAPLVQPVNVIVRDRAWWKPVLSLLGALLLGAWFVALRAQKASVTSTKIMNYFRKPANLVLVATGVAAAAVATAKAWMGAEWYGEFEQLWPLFVAQVTAMVAFPTAATALTGAGAKIQENAE